MRRGIAIDSVCDSKEAREVGIEFVICCSWGVNF